MTGIQHELDLDVCLVYSLLYGGPLKSKLSAPLLKATNSWLHSYRQFSQAPQTIINTTFCQTRLSAMVLFCLRVHMYSFRFLLLSPILLSISVMPLSVHREHSARDRTLS